MVFSFSILFFFMKILCGLLVILVVDFFSYIVLCVTKYERAERALEVVGLGIVYLITAVLVFMTAYMFFCIFSAMS